MLGTCLEAACQYRKDQVKEKQELKTDIEGRKKPELLLSFEIEQMQRQLQEEKKGKQKLKEKVELMLTQAPNPPDIVQIRKLIASPEDWDGNIWGDPCNNIPGGNDLLSPSNSPVYGVRPIIKAEVTTGPRGGWRNHNQIPTSV